MLRTRPYSYLTLFPVVLAFLVLGCASPGAKKEGKNAGEKTAEEVLDARMLQGHRYEASSLCKNYEQRRWDFWTRGNPFDEVVLLQEHAILLNPATLKLIDRMAARLSADNTRGQRQLAHFRRFVLQKLVDANITDLTEEIRALEDAAIVEIGDATIPFNQVSSVLAQEPDYNRRREITRASTRTIRLLIPHYEAKQAEAGRMATGLGYESYIALAAYLRNTDLEALAASCEAFLTATDGLYGKILPAMTEKYTGLPLANFARCDLAQLFVQPQFEVFFPAEDLLSVCHTTLLNLGLDLNRQDNITLDGEDRPEKIPRASCFPIEVPSDVRISVVPLGGSQEYEALLQELAQAEFYACSMSQVWEFTILSGDVLTEGYGRLLASLVGEAQWLDMYTGMDESVRQEFQRYVAFTRLFLLRRLCGKFLFEMEMHRGGSDAKASYRKHLSRAYGIPLTEEDAERYLMDTDDFFEEADAIRASWLGAMLAEHFRAKNGEKWFESTEVGLALRSLWGTGTELTPEETVKKLEMEEFGPQAFVREIERTLGSAEVSGS